MLHVTPTTARVVHNASEDEYMGILDKFRQPFERLASTSLASPLHDSSHLAHIVVPEYFDTARLPLTREQAIKIPALSRARLLIVSTIPRIPLVATDADGERVDVPEWLQTSTGPISPFHRMLWTVDDLFFHGWSLWLVERNETGAIIDAARVPYGKWSFNERNEVVIDNVAVPADSAVLIPGVGEGILKFGAETITEALHISRAIARAAETPSAQIELHQTNEAQMNPDQVRELIASWAKARRGENGGVAFTSSGIEVREHGAAAEHLLIDGRNAVAVDIARHAGIPATMIDATLAGSSLSYQNSAARLTELVNFGLAPLMAAVTARLSQDDVSPPGVTLSFDDASVIESLNALFKPTAETTTEKEPTDDQ